MKLFLNLFVAMSIVCSSFVLSETLSVPNVKKEVTEVVEMSKSSTNIQLNEAEQAVGLTKDSAKQSVLEKAEAVKREIAQKATISKTPIKKCQK